MAKSKILGRAQGFKCKLVSMDMAEVLWDDAFIIARKRKISTSDFIRESMQIHIKKYKQLLLKPRKD